MDIVQSARVNLSSPEVDRAIAVVVVRAEYAVGELTRVARLERFLVHRTKLLLRHRAARTAFVELLVPVLDLGLRERRHTLQVGEFPGRQTALVVAHPSRSTRVV